MSLVGSTQCNVASHTASFRRICREPWDWVYVDKMGRTEADLADDAMAEHLWGHVRYGASGLRLHSADHVHVPRQPKVRNLGAEAMRIRRA